MTSVAITLAALVLSLDSESARLAHRHGARVRALRQFLLQSSRPEFSQPPVHHRRPERRGRVPLIVVSAYAKRSYIDHARAEFSSVLKFIETNWDLPSLTDRDADSVDMTQVFDFDQHPRRPPRLEQRSDCTQY